MRQKLLKTILLFFLLAGSYVVGFAQDWQTDFQKTKQLAAAENKTIILVFAGSDWCAPCMKLEKEIWQSDEFKAFAKDHYILYKADFPRKKTNQLDDEQIERNKELAAQYNKRGYFPFVAVVDKNGKVLGETGYKKMSPKQYIDHLESFIN
ncbi:thioredoxin family protein [Prolixibacteraceae bacterium Z1-6]|uniref:Thioredoxin family protein n=1 Tax=Draconibacterium aestuarii TaxID=2998507 RepID=A0A9X3J8F5_9BACT|nr:thioredoxin family protein [Prolixibacteraceae bacterium Z1-6]